MPSTSPAPDTPRTTRGRRTRAEFEDAAKELITERGYARVTIADITERAGKSTAAFYRYFESKEHLLAALAEEFPHDVFARAPRTRSDDPDRNYLRDSAEAYWTAFRDNLGVLVGVSQRAQVDEVFARHWSRIRGAGIDVIERTIRDAQAQGSASGLDARLTATALGAMFELFCLSQLAPSDPGVTPVDDEKAIDTLADIWYRTIHFAEETAR